MFADFSTCPLNKESEVAMFRMPPYVGITGFMANELVDLNYASHKAGIAKRNMVLSAGILMSEKTLKGEGDKYPNKYPVRENVHEILRCGDDHTINTIHYSTDNVDTLELQLMTMVGMYGWITVNDPITHHERLVLDGFQLNVPWPPIARIKGFVDMCRTAERKMFVVLQVGSQALAQIEHSPSHLAEKLKGYGDLIDAVLLDPSGGTGTSMDVKIIRPLLESIHNNGQFGVGIAGGLCAEAFNGDIGQLLRDFPETSVDAEGKLRDENGELDKKKAEAYIRGAFEFYPSRQ